MNQYNNPTLSIIVPVYNAEPYLEPCIQSVCHNQQGDCELILVDDGSTDFSNSICKHYMEQYPWISLIVQKNSGPSAARNAGIELAHGEYIVFLDADDLIEMKGLLSLLDIARKSDADVVQGNIALFQANGRYTIHTVSRIKRYLERDPSNVLYAFIFEPVWPVQRIYRRSFMKKNRIRFQTQLKIHEDFEFTYQVAKHRPSVAFVNEVFYQYRTDVAGSITHIKDDKILAVFHLQHTLEAELRSSPALAMAYVRLLLFCYSRCEKQTREILMKTMHEILPDDFSECVTTAIPFFNDYYRDWAKIRFSNAMAMLCFKKAMTAMNTGHWKRAKYWLNFGVETSIRGDLIRRIAHPFEFLSGLFE